MPRLYVDSRVGGNPRTYWAERRDDLMLVPPVVRECVVFICYKAGNEILPAGTGFFVAMPINDGSRFVGYLATARHVIEYIAEKSADSKALVRMNLASGGFDLIETNALDWTFHPTDSNADVACLEFAPDSTKHKFRMLPDSMFADAKRIQDFGIGPGDDLFFPGLFVSHFGREQNLPIVRIGNIAAMPEEKVFTRKYGPIDAFLVEARSIGGLSGSPVFVHLVPGRAPDGNIQMTSEVFLLGLMHGHYDSPLTEVDLSDDLPDAARPERVNMGIAIVIPAGKITEVLANRTFAIRREMTEQMHRDAGAPTLD